MNDAQSVAASSLIVGSQMLDSVSNSDAECVTSLAPLMDLVDIIKVVTTTFEYILLCNSAFCSLVERRGI